tara:strand:- start:478 stop:942 length:465 start_codon:yes stop_codon:yes gene_type:complete
MPQETADQMDAFESMDVFGDQGDVLALKRELAHVHEQWVVDLFTKPDDAQQVAADVRNLGGRLREVPAGEEAYYALLSMGRIDGLGDVTELVREVAYSSPDHPGRESALRALARLGERAAETILAEIGSVGSGQRFAAVGVLGSQAQDPRIGIA